MYSNIKIDNRNLTDLNHNSGRRMQPISRYGMHEIFSMILNRRKHKQRQQPIKLSPIN